MSAPAGVEDTRNKDVPDPSEFAMDTTVGSYGRGREKRLILVTIDSVRHEQLVDTADNSSGGTESADESGLPRRYADLMTRWADSFGISRVADWPVPPLNVSCLIFESDGSKDLDAIIASLNKLPIVDTAAAVQTFNVLQGESYNDPYLPLQHAIRSMHADYSHRWASGRGVSIAVVDTGVNITDPEFQDRILDTKNFVDDDQKQFLSDVHGTAVAGVIAAAADNDTGMVGIAPQAKLIPMKACWESDADDQIATCNSITLLKALDIAIQEQVDIINLSLAGPRDPLLEQLVDAALERNIIVVGARQPQEPDQFPAAVPGTIAVSSETDVETGVIKAPGTRILSLHPRDAYSFFDGSSFSTAHVSGLIALIRELAPDWSFAEIDSLIRATSDIGTGASNACRSISFMVKADPAVCESRVN